MAVRLRWRNRIVGTEIRVYRSPTEFNASSLPSPLATLDPRATEYLDETVDESTRYLYGVGAVVSGVGVALSRLARRGAPGDAPAPEPPFASASYIGATVRLTASDDVEAQALPWDEVTERGATGFWSGGNPERLVVPTGASLVQVTAQLTFDGGNSYSGSVLATMLVNGSAPTPQPAASHRRQTNSSSTRQTLSYVSGPISVMPGDYFTLFWNGSNATGAVLIIDSTWMEMEVLA
jgi:hypothetical protein